MHQHPTGDWSMGDGCKEVTSSKLLLYGGRGNNAHFRPADGKFVNG